MLSDHVNINLKRGVKILTCDPSKRLIEAETRNGEVITVNAYAYTPMFRWPIPGEKWMVKEENGSWYLDGIYEPQGTEGSEVQAEPGDAVISSSSGRLLLNQEGKLTQIKNESQLSVTGYREIPGSKGKTLGTYEIKPTENARFILCIFTISSAENFGTMTVAGNEIAITERSGSVGLNYRTTLTIVLPPGVPCTIKGSNPSFVSINSLWESISGES
jgi:hypothetical protein